MLLLDAGCEACLGDRERPTTSVPAPWRKALVYVEVEASGLEVLILQIGTALLYTVLLRPEHFC